MKQNGVSGDLAGLAGLAPLAGLAWLDGRLDGSLKIYWGSRAGIIFEAFGVMMYPALHCKSWEHCFNILIRFIRYYIALASHVSLQRSIHVKLLSYWP